MSNYNSLIATINANIKQNNNQAITGQILNSVLNDMVGTLGLGYQFAGVATTSTDPGTPDAKVFYLAITPGTYTYFGNTTIGDGQIGIFTFASSWVYGVNTISAQIADNLTTNDPTKSLSARQGKVLKDMIGDLGDLDTSDKTDLVAAINENRGDLEKLLPLIVEINESIFAVIDNDLNIGAYVDDTGIHAANILEYQIISL